MVLACCAPQSFEGELKLPSLGLGAVEPSQHRKHHLGPVVPVWAPRDHAGSPAQSEGLTAPRLLRVVLPLPMLPGE